MQPAGVQVHSTGANNPNLKRYVQPDDGRIGENTNHNSHNEPGLDVCASAYIGKQADGTVAVYQTLPWDMRCWLSGKGPNGNANKLGFIGFEICEDSKNDMEYFAAVMDLASRLTAHLCLEYGIPAEKVLDHSELHRQGLASDHSDVTHWLKIYGWTMDDFRQLVLHDMANGVRASYIDCGDAPAQDEEPLFRAVVRADNGYPVKMRKEPDENAAILAKLPVGTVVEVLDVLDGWSQIRHGGMTGYMMNDFLRERGNGRCAAVPMDELRSAYDHAKALAEALKKWMEG